MKIQTDTMVFKIQERCKTGLPERLHVEKAGYAFALTRTAREKFAEELIALLDAIDPINDEEMAMLPSYADRIRSLDNLSFTLAILTDDFFSYDKPISD